MYLINETALQKYKTRRPKKKSKYNYNSSWANPDKELDSYFKGIVKIYENKKLTDRQRRIALNEFDKKFVTHTDYAGANLESYRSLNRNDYATSGDYWAEDHEKTKDNWYNDHVKNGNKWLKDFSFKNMIKYY